MSRWRKKLKRRHRRSAARSKLLAKLRRWEADACVQEASKALKKPARFVTALERNVVKNQLFVRTYGRGGKELTW